MKWWSCRDILLKKRHHSIFNHFVIHYFWAVRSALNTTMCENINVRNFATLNIARVKIVINITFIATVTEIVPLRVWPLSVHSVRWSEHYIIILRSRFTKKICVFSVMIVVDLRKKLFFSGDKKKHFSSYVFLCLSLSPPLTFLKIGQELCLFRRPLLTFA